MLTEDFNYILPQERIAQKRIRPYDHSKLLILDKKSSEIHDSIFFHVIDELTADDVLVFNDTKVFKSRLKGKKETGKELEILLLEPANGRQETYRCIIHGKVLEGTTIHVSDTLHATVVSLHENGDRSIAFNTRGTVLQEAIEALASPAIPHYINSPDEYQTVYADPTKEQSIAAPT